jgi:hypothetical protein
MARTVRDSNLESRTARSRLKARGKPYYRRIDEGVCTSGSGSPPAGPASGS